MAKNIGGDIAETGSDVWNVAQGYTSLKILKPLIEMDKLVKIARYGCENVEDSLYYNQNPELKTQMRIDAINRLVDNLRELFENSEFAMKRKKTDKALMALAERTTAVLEVLPGIIREETDQRSNTTRVAINEQHFAACLNELRDIKKEIPKPLNDNSLIFPTSDEFDLESIKRDIIDGG